MKYVLCLHKYGVPLDDPCAFPLGFMYVSSVLKSQGHDVRVLNYNLQDYDFAKEVEDADFALFTGFEEFTERNQRFAAIASAMGVKTVLGGAMATFEADSQHPFFGTVIKGEFEDWLELDFRKSPYPDYEGFGIQEYHRRNGIRHIGVLTSRGCPHHCTFCAHTCKFRVRSLADVETEIDHYISAYRPDLLVFNDNTLNSTARRFKDICKMMKSKGLAWSAAIRVDNFDEECAQMAKESGCRYFVVGVESLRQEKLDRMRKGTTVEQVLATLNLLKRYDINYHGNVIFGIAGDTNESVAQEVCSIPWQEHGILPVAFRPFAGVKERVSTIPADVLQQFRDYVYAQGKYMYAS